MSIQQIRSILTKKNLNRSLGAVVDYLEELVIGGGSGGGNAVVDEVEAISLPVNFSDILPSFDTITAKRIDVSIVADGETVTGEVDIGIPQGRDTYDILRIIYAADESSGGRTLFITPSGFPVFDPTNTYLMPRFEIYAGGSVELIWDANFEVWNISRHQNTSLPEFAVGKTVYEFTYDDDNTTTEFFTGYNDVIVRLYSNAVLETELGSIIYNGNIGGQRMTFSVDVTGLTLTSSPNSFLLPNNNAVQSIVCNGIGSSLLLEWKASIQSWVILDYSSDIVLN